MDAQERRMRCFEVAAKFSRGINSLVAHTRIIDNLVLGSGAYENTSTPDPEDQVLDHLPAPSPVPSVEEGASESGS